MSCSRKDMNDTLTEVLLAACVTPTLMPDRLLMEHVLLVSILHHAVGLEVRTPPLSLHFDVYRLSGLIQVDTKAFRVEMLRSATWINTIAGACWCVRNGNR